jgi:hypothetical protein
MRQIQLGSEMTISCFESGPRPFCLGSDAAAPGISAELFSRSSVRVALTGLADWQAGTTAQPLI